MVAECGNAQRPKLFYAAILGRAVVKEAWVGACVAAGACLPLVGSLVWQAARDPQRMFAGVRVLLHSPSAYTQQAEKLLRQAGKLPCPSMHILDLGIMPGALRFLVAGQTLAIMYM